jgi:hypothetical protein
MNHRIDDWVRVENGLWIQTIPIGGPAFPHPSPGGGISVSIQMEERCHVGMDPRILLLLTAAATAKEAEEVEAG